MCQEEHYYLLLLSFSKTLTEMSVLRRPPVGTFYNFLPEDVFSLSTSLTVMSNQ